MTTDMLSSLCAAIAQVGAGITGINAQGVFDPPPVNLQTAELPALFVWTGGGAHNEAALGENFIETTRRFYVQVAVIPTGQGDPNTRETLVRPLLEATLQQFRKYPRLASVSWVERMTVAADSGVVILPEYGGKFIGFEISLDITYLAPRTFAAGE